MEQNYVLIPSVCINYPVLQVEPGRQYPLCDLTNLFAFSMSPPVRLCKASSKKKKKSKYESVHLYNLLIL